MRKINQTQAREAIQKREEFEASALSATKGWTAAGDLPDDIARAYVEARADDRITYTVLSYFTPIMWETTDGKIHIPARRYSVTTTQHQHTVRWALNDERERFVTYGEEKRAVPVGSYGSRAGW